MVVSRNRPPSCLSWFRAKAGSRRPGPSSCTVFARSPRSWTFRWWWTGCGRTGTWFAFEQHGIEPDVVVASNALGRGLPVSVLLYDGWRPGAHTATFCGNQLAFAAGAALLRVIDRDHVLDNMRVVGARLRSGLELLKERHAWVSDVRRLGLMLGVELRSAAGRPAEWLARRLHRACLQRGPAVRVGRPRPPGDPVPAVTDPHPRARFPARDLRPALGVRPCGRTPWTKPWPGWAGR
jgi:hypothetical protein